MSFAPVLLNFTLKQLFVHCAVRDTALIIAGVCVLMLVLIISFVVYVYR